MKYFFYRSNVQISQISKVNNFDSNKSLQFEFELDSDPDAFFEFQEEIIKANSDSALHRIKKCSSLYQLYDSQSTSKESLNTDKENIYLLTDSWWV